MIFYKHKKFLFFKLFTFNYSLFTTMICLYIGRFQPFHIGHLDVISQIFSHQVKNIVIGVWSINKHDDKNPRSFPERKEMILVSLEEAGYDLERFEVVGIPDFTEDEDRLSYITETINFDILMSGNPLVTSIFEDNNFQVLEEQERIKIHGTDIRNMIKERNWEEIEKWVTKGIFEKIKKASFSRHNT